MLFDIIKQYTANVPECYILMNYGTTAWNQTMASHVDFVIIRFHDVGLLAAQSTPSNPGGPMGCFFVWLFPPPTCPARDALPVAICRHHSWVDYWSTQAQPLCQVLATPGWGRMLYTLPNLLHVLLFISFIAWTSFKLAGTGIL
jgi:hypothetical protein